ncbi:hypothetical protein [Nostoc sp.]
MSYSSFFTFNSCYSQANQLSHALDHSQKKELVLVLWLDFATKWSAKV